MPIDLNAIGQTKESVFEYNWKDVVLYALGIGAQTNELPFLYERTQGGVKVFPSYAVIAGDGAAPFEKLGSVDWAKFIHGEQYIKLYRPFPSQGKITRKGTITNIYDKGKNAIIHSIRQGFNEKGEHIFDAKWIHVLLDGGG
ncbi:MAG: MaoC family dehydratase N-terminal domain-containing protein, partial [Candidatus Lokiarchaeota archaeon]|nr:MaoC family dehydratase N-terminal domain-containing protein [Candidatus Lokiarchaeota archaeon]